MDLTQFQFQFIIWPLIEHSDPNVRTVVYTSTVFIYLKSREVFGVSEHITRDINISDGKDCSKVDVHKILTLQLQTKHHTITLTLHTGSGQTLIWREEGRVWAMSLGPPSLTDTM